jgi:hypothetical protein
MQVLRDYMRYVSLDASWLTPLLKLCVLSQLCQVAVTREMPMKTRLDLCALGNLLRLRAS